MLVHLINLKPEEIGKEETGAKTPHMLRIQSWEEGITYNIWLSKAKKVVAGQGGKPGGRQERRDGGGRKRRRKEGGEGGKEVG